MVEQEVFVVLDGLKAQVSIPVQQISDSLQSLRTIRADYKNKIDTLIYILDTVTSNIIFNLRSSECGRTPRKTDFLYPLAYQIFKEGKAKVVLREGNVVVDQYLVQDSSNGPDTRIVFRLRSNNEIFWIEKTTP